MLSSSGVGNDRGRGIVRGRGSCGGRGGGGLGGSGWENPLPPHQDCTFITRLPCTWVTRHV
jgi:hypothetical protein